ncbi:MAG: hypothetical protein ACREAA_16395 [Candidatus Polarisedimenticolia bacterium]
MVEVKFGHKGDPPSRLIRSEDLVAIRTRALRTLIARAAKSPAVGLINDAQLVMEFPEAGVAVYRLAPGGAEALRGDPELLFAGGVLMDETTGEPVLYTENLFVKFVDGADQVECFSVLRDAGLTIKRELPYAANGYFVAAREGIGIAVFDLAQKLLQRDDVECCHPEVVRRRAEQRAT